MNKTVYPFHDQLPSSLEVISSREIALSTPTAEAWRTKTVTKTSAVPSCHGRYDP